MTGPSISRANPVHTTIKNTYSGGSAGISTDSRVHKKECKPSTKYAFQFGLGCSIIHNNILKKLDCKCRRTRSQASSQGPAASASTSRAPFEQRLARRVKKCGRNTTAFHDIRARGSSSRKSQVAHHENIHPIISNAHTHTTIHHIHGTPSSHKQHEPPLHRTNSAQKSVTGARKSNPKITKNKPQTR